MPQEKKIEKTIILESNESTVNDIKEILIQKDIDFFIAADFQRGMEKIKGLNKVISKEASEILEKINNKRDDYLTVLDYIKEKSMGNEFSIFSKATLDSDKKIQEKIVKSIIARNYVVLADLYIKSTKSAISSTMFNKLKKLYENLPEHLDEKYKKEIHSIILLMENKQMEPPLGLYILLQCFSMEIPCLVTCQEPLSHEIQSLINLLHFSQTSGNKITKKTLGRLFYSMFKNNKLSWISTINDRIKIYSKTVNTDAVNTLKSIVY